MSLNCSAFSAEPVAHDSVMNLFVHDYENTKSLDSLSPVEKFSESEMLRQEFDQVLYLRNAMKKALQDDNLERLKTLVDVADSYEKSSTYFIVHDCEKLLLKYFLGVFDSLSDVQFVSRYNTRPDYVYDAFHKTLKEKLKAEIESGKLDEKLKSVDDESDRLFIYIVLNGFFKYKYDIASLIEKYKFQLKKREQLEYLVDTYWDRKTVDNDVRSSDTLHFTNIGLNLNVGYFFRNISLLCYLTTGVEVDSYGENKSYDDKRRTRDDLHQVYPVYGAGALIDLLFFRFRAGVKNIWGDHTVNASGFRFYMSFELAIPMITMKPVKFIYPDSMDR